MKYIIGYDENKCSINLIKTESGINEKFEILLNEILLMKKDMNSKINEKLKKIEILIIDIKDNTNRKLEENINIKNTLKKKIENNTIKIENNNKILCALKNEINKNNDGNIVNDLKKEFNNIKNNSNPKNIRFSDDIINVSQSR